MTAMTEPEFDAYAKEHGITAACWETFDRWCREHAEANPDDDLTLDELIEKFSAAPERKP